MMELWQGVQEWGEAQPALMGWLFVLSVVMFVGSLVILPVLIVRIPHRYFMPDYVPEHPNPVLRVLKNIVGAIFVLAGIAMLVLPGQGLLTIFIGMTQLDFPGKRALERRVVSIPLLRLAIDALRRKRGHPPLEFPE